MARRQKKTKNSKANEQKTAERGRPEAERTSRRLLETLGILTLASALLTGPSLASVQFGDGRLMGPFGELVGRALNYVLGLGGYAFVAALLLISLKIFAGALGRSRSGVTPVVRWRQRVGVGIGVIFGAVLLHLVFRPEQVGSASFGGVLGEVLGEILCALLSTPGAWVICLSALALSLVLATRFSWAQGAVWLWIRARSWIGGLGAMTERAHKRAVALGEYMARQLAQPRKEAVSADGTAAMPPVVRLDLEPERCEEEPKELAGPILPVIADQMPADLEIGKSAEPPEPPELPEVAVQEPASLEEFEAGQKKPKAGIKPPKAASSKAAKAASSKAAKAASPKTPEELAQLVASELAAEADAAAGEPSAPEPKAKAKQSGDEEADELTIVESKFETEGEGQAAEVAKEEECKTVEQTDGPGFKLNYETYRHPPISLLENHERGQSTVDREAIYAQAELLVKTLADYKIVGKVKKVHPGPVVTMYEFVPAPGTRISKVANLANDLAMSLKAQRVRIVAPIPGKGAIGIEVPNASREVVSFKKIVADEAFRNPKSKLTLAVGKNIFGAPVSMDLAKMPHLLVAGATGAGKSVSINSMICSLLLKCTPEEVRMIMVDPKFLELSGYNDIPHLLLPVVTDPKKANIALRWAVAEMERRYQLLAETRVRDIASYNRKVAKLRGEAEAEAKGAALDATVTMREARPSKVLVVRKRADGTEEPLAGTPAVAEDAGQAETAPAVESQPGEQQVIAEVAAADKKKKQRDAKNLKRLPYIVVIIDEFADLMMCAAKEVEQSVARLAQKARAAGIHLIVATQRPSVDVITGLIKANFPSRMAFQVASNHDSKTILGCQGAENLLGAGDMLVLDRGTEMKRIHGAYISDDEIKNVVDWLRDQGRPVYDMEILKPPEDEEDEGGALDDEDMRDELYDRAVQFVAESQQVSISKIQRRLRIGYNRSARIVERMEREGVVSEPDGPRGRTVLIKPI